MGYVPGRCLLKKRLREIRQNQQWLAVELGMPKAQISDYANNRKVMSLGTAKTISMKLGCYIDDLYDFYEQ
jgi:plasmid maintenance system antidote protein VapI